MKTLKNIILFYSFLILILFFVSTPAVAQFGIGVGFGAQQMNVSKLNEFNRNNDFPEINQFQFLSTISFVVGTKNYFIEVNNEMISNNTENDKFKIENSSKFAFMNMAYNFSKNEKHRIYPLLGFGYGLLNLDYTEKSSGSSTFLDFMNSPAKTHSIRNESVVIRFGGGWMYRLTSGDPDKKLMGESIGLQVGYNLPVYFDTWETADGSAVTDVPTMSIQGFYAKLSLQFF